MKILHLITGLGYGGAESMLLNLLSHFRKEGIENHVVSLTGDGPTGQQIRAQGIPVETLNMSRGRFSISGFQKLLQIIQKTRPDVLQTWLYHADLVGGLTRLAGSQVPVVWGVHHTARALHLLKPSTRFVIRVNCMISHFLPSRIICCSESAYQSHLAMGYPAGKMHIIPNGVDAVRFRPDIASRIVLRRQLGVAEDTVLIGHSGRFVPAKGHALFIRAAWILHQSYPDVHFVMCGKEVEPGNSRLWEWIMTAGLSSQVHLLGPLPNLEKMLQGLDFFVSSSMSEALPLTVAEAMACQIPCVVTDAGDQGMLIGDTGILVPSESAAALADGCCQMLAMPESQRHSLGHAARTRILEAYALEEAARRYFEVYQQLLEACTDCL
jgi:glycosyltransferase involved in cell wall biosynthesis